MGWRPQAKKAMQSGQFQSVKGISEKMCLEIGLEGGERGRTMYLLGRTVPGIGGGGEERTAKEKGGSLVRKQDLWTVETDGEIGL